MKKNLLVAGLLVCLAGGSIAQNVLFVGQNTVLNQPKTLEIQWQNTSHNFGKISQNVPVTAVFEFKNTSNAPLIVKSAVGSCGCTVAEYPKQPIPAGKSGVIKATFNAANMGVFNKTVTIETNAETTILSLTGEVITK